MLIIVLVALLAYYSYFDEIMNFVGEIVEEPIERLARFWYHCHEHRQ